ncbi:hypothetical protein C487_12758 [Natrinema pallidum DSM 3751]|uniref:Uncharacterized protein n=1 Tax=Natrinema pallidum DSM 3751 TaxID=1227495 RepID=L9YSU1_9EURY|nr:hypothetical protein C487_12758 [Natrinema pallidum DSM 3751]
MVATETISHRELVGAAPDGGTDHYRTRRAGPPHVDTHGRRSIRDSTMSTSISERCRHSTERRLENTRDRRLSTAEPLPIDATNRA